MENEFQTFWMIYSPTGAPPTFSHSTLEMAKKEAARLAIAHPGHRFFVLEAIEACEKREVAWIFANSEMSASGEVPF